MNGTHMKGTRWTSGYCVVHRQLRCVVETAMGQDGGLRFIIATANTAGGHWGEVWGVCLFVLGEEEVMLAKGHLGRAGTQSPTFSSIFFLMDLAIDTKASSTLMLALALVSMKGTPYSAASYERRRPEGRGRGGGERKLRQATAPWDMAEPMLYSCSSQN